MMLRHQITFGIEKDKHNRPIGTQRAKSAVESIIQYVSRLFGGCTAIETQGGWYDEHGTYFPEKGICLWTDTDDPQAADKFAELADIICDLLDQNCVTYSQIPVTTQFLSRRPDTSA